MSVAQKPQGTPRTTPDAAQPATPPPTPPATSPVVAPNSGSAATASDPELPLEGQHYHIYEAHPAPWWIAALWIAFFIFGVTYLITNLLR